jgi:hypothetical protein
VPYKWGEKLPSLISSAGAIDVVLMSDLIYFTEYYTSLLDSMIQLSWLGSRQCDSPQASASSPTFLLSNKTRDARSESTFFRAAAEHFHIYRVQVCSAEESESTGLRLLAGGFPLLHRHLQADTKDPALQLTVLVPRCVEDSETGLFCRSGEKSREGSDGFRNCSNDGCRCRECSAAAGAKPLKKSDHWLLKLLEMHLQIFDWAASD